MSRLGGGAWFAALALLLWQPALAAADTIRLKNGNVLEGEITGQNERQVTINLPDVGVLVVDRSDISSVEDAGEEAPAEETSASAPAQPAQPVSPDQLALFERPERDVKFWYPKGWHVQDRLDRHPYTVTISPKPFDAASRDLVVLELRKFYHASRTAGLKTPAGGDMAEPFIRKFRERGAQLLDQAPVQIQGVPGMRAEARASGSRSVSRLLIAAVAKDDALVSLYGQAPMDTFEQHRGFFEAALERMAPFAAEQTDNARLDAESARLTAAAVEAVKRGDADSALSRMQEALRGNPGDVMSRASYATLLFDLALQKKEPQRGQLLARAEAELKQVTAWLEEMKDPAQAPTLAQAYFLLGEVELRGRNRQQQARTLYEKALAAHPGHPGAKRALGR